MVDLFIFLVCLPEGNPDSSARPVVHHLVIGRAEALLEQLQHRAVRQDLFLSEGSLPKWWLQWAGWSKFEAYWNPNPWEHLKDPQILQLYYICTCTAYLWNQHWNHQTQPSFILVQSWCAMDRVSGSWSYFWKRSDWSTAFTETAWARKWRMLRHHRPSVHDQRHTRSILPPRGSLDDLTRDHCVTADRGAGKTAILSDSYIWNMRTKWIRYRTPLLQLSWNRFSATTASFEYWFP